MVTGQGYGWVLVGVRGCVLRPIGHSLVTLFPCLCQLRTGHCISLEASHRFIIPSTYLLMGAGKTRCSLIVDPALSGPTDWRRGWWRSLHHMEFRTQDVGAWSPSLDGDLDTRDRRVMGQSCLCLGTSGACVLGHPAGHIDSRIAGLSGTACLRFSTVVRTES